MALDLSAAEALAGAVEEAGVATQLLLTWRYVPEVRALLEAASGRRGARRARAGS